MADTDCARFADLLLAYVDHELTDKDSAAVERHVRACQACSDALRRYQRDLPRLDAGIRSVLGDAPERLPEHRRARGLHKYGVFEAPAWHAFNLVGRGLGVAVLAAVCALIVAVFARAAPQQTPGVQTATQPSVATSGPVVVASVSGTVDPLVRAHIERALAHAESLGAPFVLSLDTHGGQKAAIDAISSALANAAVPTVTYVSRAAGGSDSIAAASDVVAAAPGASLPGSTVLADRDLRGVLEAVDGQVVQTSVGPATLATAGAAMQPVEMGFWEAFAHRLFDPTVAYVLFMLGLFALLLELAQPGGLVLGAAGAVGSGLGLMVFATALPVNWLGLALIAAGVGLWVVELHWPTHGLLGVVGGGCLVAGSVLLYAPIGIGTLPLIVLLAMGGLGLVLALWVAQAAAVVRHVPALDPLADLSGARGETRSTLDPEGVVFVAGQLWSARLVAGRLGPREPIRVLARRGLVLDVEPAAYRLAATQKGAVR
jgi:membrane-bound serine protease (ClpP class)